MNFILLHFENIICRCILHEITSPIVLGESTPECFHNLKKKVSSYLESDVIFYKKVNICCINIMYSKSL